MPEPGLDSLDVGPVGDEQAREVVPQVVVPEPGYRSYLVTVAKRATPTVNKHLAALQDFYTWRGLGKPRGVKRHKVPRHAPKALDPRA